MDLSIVVPAYNEEKRIAPSLEKLYSYFGALYSEFEIIVVDDGSTDRTTEIIDEFAAAHPELCLLKHGKNRGKGAAVQTGVLSSAGRLVMFSDSDMSTPAEEFEKLKEAIEDGYDIAIGSRGLQDSFIALKQPLYRRLPGRIFPFLVRVFVMKNFRDTQCGFKLFTDDAAKFLFGRLKTYGFAFDVEILFRAVQNNYKVKEIPVKWYNSRDSRVNLMKDPIKMLAKIMTIKKTVNR